MKYRYAHEVPANCRGAFDLLYSADLRPRHMTVREREKSEADHLRILEERRRRLLYAAEARELRDANNFNPYSRSAFYGGRE